VKPIIARTAILLALAVAGVSLACTQAASADQKPCAEPGNSSKSLSDKLEQGGGVICPPNVDPGMKTPAPPETGKMPVIPPPGSPGGDPKVQPK
jgi:hypothetical protein